MDLHGYIDESYNSERLCVGGFMAPISVWSKIETPWSERIRYENRKSARKGFPSISRYHATDCANLKNEFAEDKGWDISRQILLSKRLCEIIADHHPTGIVIGGSLADVKRHFPMEQDKAKRILYKLSFMMYMICLAKFMASEHPSDRVTMYWDRSKEFSSIARQEFDSFMSDPDMTHFSKYFLTGAPLGWEDCIALQPADLMAYEGMKRIGNMMQGKEDVRKSLRAIIGQKTEILIGHYTDDNFKDLLKMANNREEQRRLSEGVESGLGEWHANPKGL